MSDFAKIKQLRKLTGAGFNDCSNALKEANDDIDKATEVLRVKGIAKASKKMSREANEGVVALSGDDKKASIIEVNCETDFVAKNDDFINFVKELSEINNNCESDIQKVKLSKMKNSQTVDENLISIIAKIGEKITIGRTRTISHDSSTNFNYLHAIVKDNLSKLAVIISLQSKITSDKIKLFGKQLAMHVAASNPLALDIDDIDKDILEKEEELVAEELNNTGKSEDIVKKISLGKMNKFKEDNSLMTQQWVMEPKKKVKNIIEELGFKDLKIIDFYRIKIGD